MGSQHSRADDDQRTNDHAGHHLLRDDLDGRPRPDHLGACSRRQRCFGSPGRDGWCILCPNAYQPRQPSMERSSACRVPIDSDHHRAHRGRAFWDRSSCRPPSQRLRIQRSRRIASRGGGEAVQGGEEGFKQSSKTFTTVRTTRLLPSESSTRPALRQWTCFMQSLPT